MIDRTPYSDSIPIFIADRGFHSLNVFVHAIEHGSYFLIRAKDVNMRCLLGSDLPAEECFYIHINRILTRSQSKKKRLHPELEQQYRFICKEVSFDYMEVNDGEEYHIPLRILRLRRTRTCLGNR